MLHGHRMMCRCFVWLIRICQWIGHGYKICWGQRVRPYRIVYLRGNQWRTIVYSTQILFMCMKHVNNAMNTTILTKKIRVSLPLPLHLWIIDEPIGVLSRNRSQCMHRKGWFWHRQWVVSHTAETSLPSTHNFAVTLVCIDQWVCGEPVFESFYETTKYTGPYLRETQLCALDSWWCWIR